MPQVPVLERHGWKLYAHPAFNERFLDLITKVEQLQKQDSGAYKEHPRTKLLARIHRLIFEEIPKNPNAPEFQQGNTLGERHRHWRRAKFLGRFRLFYRFSSSHNVIIYAWVNDESSLRKSGASTDPYALFKKGLEHGNPPNSWDDLLRVSECVKDSSKLTGNSETHLRPGRSNRHGGSVAQRNAAADDFTLAHAGEYQVPDPLIREGALSLLSECWNTQDYEQEDRDAKH